MTHLGYCFFGLDLGSLSLFLLFSPFIIWYASHDRRGFGNLMVPLLLALLPLSLFDMLLMTGGGFGNLMVPLWLALLGGLFVFWEVWVLPFCSLFSPFFCLGALVNLLWLAGFHHHFPSCWMFCFMKFARVSTIDTHINYQLSCWIW